jgi:hypothetical protein
VAFPTGDRQAKLVAQYQPVSLAAMEGRFESGAMAGITLIGQPNCGRAQARQPIKVPGVLSFLAFGTFHSNVPGLPRIPDDQWPDNIELLYYAFHSHGRPRDADDRADAAFREPGVDRTTLHERDRCCGCLMLAFPFPVHRDDGGAG